MPDNHTHGLRQWSEIHIDEQIPALTGNYENALFYNCTICSVAGATFKNCCFDKSTVKIDAVKDMADVTLTLNCHSFVDVEYSETAFDSILLLLIRTSGNTHKRRKLFAMLGKERVAALLNSPGFKQG